MNYSHLTLVLLFVSGSTYCFDGAGKTDPFKAGKVYDKDGNYIYIERPLLRPNDIIINQWYGVRRTRTRMCLLAAIGSAWITLSLALPTLQGNKCERPLLAYNDLFSGQKATLHALIVQLGATCGFGWATLWLARKTKSLMKAEDDGIEPARKFAATLKENLMKKRSTFNRIEFVESKYIG